MYYSQALLLFVTSYIHRRWVVAPGQKAVLLNAYYLHVILMAL